KCKNNSIYIGQTSDLEKRWKDHLEGKVDWTAKYQPLEIIHYEEYSTREEAVKREKELKTGFGRKWLKRELKAGRLRKWKGGTARQAGQKGGFDVVIANPPYVRQEKIKEQKTSLQKAGYEIYNSTSDLYTYFYERAYKILKPDGFSYFISSNKWMRAKYGEKLRRFFKQKTGVITLIDFGGYPVFEATVDTNIILFKKKTPLEDDNVHFVNVKSKLEDEDLISYIEENQDNILQKKLDDKCWTLADERILKLKEKIEEIGTSLKNWDVNIYFGIKTGYNEAFIITTEKRNEILANCKTEEEKNKTAEIIKPILRGRDIGRYYYKWAGLWLIKTESGWTNENRRKEDPKKFFKSSYSAIYDHLISFANKKGKGKGLFNRDDQGDYWWELRDCSYYPEFEKEKIVWQEIVREPSFAYDAGKFYCEATSFLMTGNNLKYLIAVLNSKPTVFFFKLFYAGGGLGEKGYRYKKAFLEQFPIPEISKKEQLPFITLVTKILSLTQSEDYLENPQKQAKVKEYECQIDQMVYNLYDLTEDEIKIVEGGKRDKNVL
ncbi:Eco57I restriction-modification methylase domain-containing protein, partial [Candidatus Aerophobetes bacterium]|nr:Eco57I restriction-modification methylase domain-containing protein [Candidatus Aerophobetes bacterium]